MAALRRDHVRGLLISMPTDEAEQYVKLMKEHDISETSIIGTVKEKQEYFLYAGK